MTTVQTGRREGDAAWGGGPAGRSADVAVCGSRVLALIRQKYSGDAATGFGPTLIAQHLASEDGLTVDHETVRRWMLVAGLWSQQRRERTAHFGELVELDGSFHACTRIRDCGGVC